MATAYISFCRGLAADTASLLISGCKTLASEADNLIDPATGQITGTKQKWDTIDLSITCGGGDILAGFACYNELKGLPVIFNTRNCGAVDSAAIMLFLLGTKRYASQSSAFFFHQPAWSFPSQANVPVGLIGDAAEYLGHYQRMMTELVAAKSKLSAANVHQMMMEGTTVLAADAKKNGLVADVAELSIPFGSRWWQV